MKEFEESILRENAVFFAKGSMPDVIERFNIPLSAFEHRGTYIVAIIPADKETKELEADIAKRPIYTIEELDKGDYHKPSAMDNSIETGLTNNDEDQEEYNDNPGNKNEY